MRCKFAFPSKTYWSHSAKTSSFGEDRVSRRVWRVDRKVHLAGFVWARVLDLRSSGRAKSFGPCASLSCGSVHRVSSQNGCHASRVWTTRPVTGNLHVCRLHPQMTRIISSALQSPRWIPPIYQTWSRNVCDRTSGRLIKILFLPLCKYDDNIDLLIHY